MMELVQDITVIADRKEKTSSKMSSKLMLKLNDDVTKGAFIEIVKKFRTHQLFNHFYKLQRVRLKGQFLKMDVSKFYTLMKIKLSTHADWDRWLSRLLEVTQDCALVQGHVQGRRVMKGGNGK